MENINWVAILLDLIITAFGYLFVPAIIRMFIGKIEQRKAKKIAIINAIVVDIAFFVLASIISEETPKVNVFPAILWGTIGYSLINGEYNTESNKVKNNKIICEYCGSKNNSKREYCWLCGRTLKEEKKGDKENKIEHLEKITRKKDGNTSSNTAGVKDEINEKKITHGDKENAKRSRTSILWFLICMCLTVLLIYQSYEVSELKETIASKNNTINKLNTQVSELNGTISTQESTIEDLTKKLEQAITILNLINNARK